MIASGGVGSIADIDALMAAKEPNIEGVVVGRALYDGRIDVAEALRAPAYKLAIQINGLKRLSGLAQPADEVVQLFQAGIGDLAFPHLYPLCG